MPSTMSNRLRGTLRAATGWLMLAVIAVGWVSLLSWSVRDPSLSHQTAHAARNWLGGPGSIISDVLVQSFGLASPLILVAPLAWALSLIAKERPAGIRWRIVGWLGSILGGAGALAGPQAPLAWPLVGTGFGGIAGDLLMRTATAFAPAQTLAIARPVAAAVFALLALAGLAGSLGGWRRGAARAAGRQTEFTSAPVVGSAGAAGPAAGFEARIEPTFAAARPPSAEPARAAPFRPDAAPQSAHRGETAHVTAAATSTSPAGSHAAAAAPRSGDRYGPYASFDPAGDDYGDPAFEDWTDMASGGIAARFAPAARSTAENGPRELRAKLSDAFEPAPSVLASPAPRIMKDAPAAERLAGANKVAAGYKRPSLNLLAHPGAVAARPAFSDSLVRGNARLLEEVFGEFGVNGRVRQFTPGPVVTIYEFEPQRGTNVARVIALADDIARGMNVPAVRIAELPGRQVLAVELPNGVRQRVVLRDIFDADAYRATMDQLPIALGRTVAGDPVVADLARTPALLVAGMSGSGKSVGLNAIILSLLYKHGPADCRMLLIDPRMLDLAAFNGIPHLLTPVVSDPHKAVSALAWCVTEMEERLKRMASLGVRNIDVFNNRVRNARKRGERLGRTIQTGFDKRTGEATYVHEEMNPEPLPHIIVVVDEFAELMAVAGREVEGAVGRLATAAKMVGIHLIMATGRPAPEVVTAPLRNHLPARLSYKAARPSDSRAVLGVDGAEQLLGHGDLLFDDGTEIARRIHGPLVTGEEVDAVASALRQQGAPAYVEALNIAPPPLAPRPAETPRATAGPSLTVVPQSEDALYDRAVAIVVRDRQTSLGQLQRRLNISPAWAATLIARLEAARLITPADDRGIHKVIVAA